MERRAAANPLNRGSYCYSGMLGDDLCNHGPSVNLYGVFITVAIMVEFATVKSQEYAKKGFRHFLQVWYLDYQRKHVVDYSIAEHKR